MEVIGKVRSTANPTFSCHRMNKMWHHSESACNRMAILGNSLSMIHLEVTCNNLTEFHQNRISRSRLDQPVQKWCYIGDHIKSYTHSKSHNFAITCCKTFILWNNQYTIRDSLSMCQWIAFSHLKDQPSRWLNSELWTARWAVFIYIWINCSILSNVSHLHISVHFVVSDGERKMNIQHNENILFLFVASKCFFSSIAPMAPEIPLLAVFEVK